MPEFLSSSDFCVPNPLFLNVLMCLALLKISYQFCAKLQIYGGYGSMWWGSNLLTLIH